MLHPSSLPFGTPLAGFIGGLCCVGLPWVFWMHLCSGGKPLWLASAAMAILAFYLAADWRIATVGVAVGTSATSLLFEAVGPVVPPMPSELFWADAMVFATCVVAGISLGISSAHRRRDQLDRTLSTVSIMAHELRTPLATMALIGDAVRGSAADASGDGAAKLEQLAMRLHTLVRNMNHQVDIQITNARLARPPGRMETVSAENMVRTAVANYPFRSTRERDCVRVNVQRDFSFRGSSAAFTQVVDNLVKNALRSLAASNSAMQPADIAIEVGMQRGRGRIVVADRGVGISHESQPRIFELFFSTHRGTGHGLGLAFCRQVVRAARGSIRVRSAPGQGAVFTIELPVSRRG